MTLNGRLVTAAESVSGWAHGRNTATVMWSGTVLACSQQVPLLHSAKN